MKNTLLQDEMQNTETTLIPTQMHMKREEVSTILTEWLDPQRKHLINASAAKRVFHTFLKVINIKKDVKSIPC